MYRSMMTRRKIHMSLPAAVGTKDPATTSSSRPKTSAFWWTKKATKVHKNPTVDTKNLETKRIGSYYVPPTLSSRPQVPASRSNDFCPPASPETTPKRSNKVNFLLATPRAILRANNISSPSSPVTPLEQLRAHYRSAPLSPPPLKKKLITVDQIQDRDLQRLQIPIIQEFYFQNKDFEGDEPANRCRKWRLPPLPPRPNPRIYV